MSSTSSVSDATSSATSSFEVSFDSPRLAAMIRVNKANTTIESYQLHDNIRIGVPKKRKQASRSVPIDVRSPTTTSTTVYRFRTFPRISGKSNQSTEPVASGDNHAGQNIQINVYNIITSCLRAPSNLTLGRKRSTCFHGACA